MCVNREYVMLRFPTQLGRLTVLQQHDYAFGAEHKRHSDVDCQLTREPNSRTQTHAHTHTHTHT
jgi:hypothetical protein